MIDMPREKLERSSIEALSDRELVALILRSGCAGRGVLELAGEVLAALPKGLESADYRRLRRVKGMGRARAASMAAALELAKRQRGLDARPVLDRAERVAEQVPFATRAARKEHFLAYYLNARSQLIHSETISIGTLSASLVHPREVFSPSLSHCAAAVIVAHNHPSGDCTPSLEDKDATRRLQRAGELLGVPLLDHVIVSGRGFFSFREHGLLATA